MTVASDVATCRLVETGRCLWGAYCPHDGRNKHLGNVGQVLPHNTRSTTQNSHLHICRHESTKCHRQSALFPQRDKKTFHTHTHTHTHIQGSNMHNEHIVIGRFFGSRTTVVPALQRKHIRLLLKCGPHKNKTVPPNLNSVYTSNIQNCAPKAYPAHVCCAANWNWNWGAGGPGGGGEREQKRQSYE
jgi:hypothetical protein